eukprot:TRINITY_DN71773_c0_g1_i1.p1 TRINITY_DN71773_c0_g1~~TRINITY_DN71773_c0_g1_i1.p1  ORF type:complete len:148 (-),score=23.98 TRINITY_DN71773_c0_g1_i1:73-516(-)
MDLVSLKAFLDIASQLATIGIGLSCVDSLAANLKEELQASRSVCPQVCCPDLLPATQTCVLETPWVSIVLLSVGLFVARFALGAGVVLHLTMEVRSLPQQAVVAEVLPPAKALLQKFDEPRTQLPSVASSVVSGPSGRTARLDEQCL